MLKKINTSLGIIAIVGLLFCGGVFLYTHFSNIENSHIVQQLGG
jgi:hypothetical protein